MRQGRPSSTAAYVAAWRALGEFLPVENRLCEDPLGWRFVPPWVGRLQRVLERHPASARRVLEASPLWRLLLWIQLRTRAIDDLAVAFAREGGRQIVLLGAGFDLRAIRMAPELPEVRFFEVDHPATQQRKRSILGRERLASGAALVPWDFERDPVAGLAGALATQGLDRARPTLTIWEGVIPYLTEAAVESTLAAVRTFGGPGSRVVLHYIERRLVEGNTLWHLAARRVGEPLRFGWDPEALPGWLRSRGFELLEDRDDNALAREYFGGGWDGTFKGAGGRVAVAGPG